MFTGIIESVGTVVSIETHGGDVRLYVRSTDVDWSDVALGDSIATSGVCLTAIKLPGDGFYADVSIETLGLTTVGHWKTGTRVNLEKALTPQSRLGGHIVSGHVDGVGEILSRHQEARSERLVVRAPAELAKYIAHKGSITVDGISLTVNSVKDNEFDLNIVPHTMGKTIIGEYCPGTKVNLEVDLIARYLERLLMGDNAAQSIDKAADLSREFLADNGYPHS